MSTDLKIEPFLSLFDPTETTGTATNNVANGGIVVPAFNAPGPFQPAGFQNVQPVDIQAVTLAARKEEKDKLYKDIEKSRKLAKEAEERALKAEEEARTLRANSLPIDEQLKSQMADIQKKLTEAEAARQAAEARAHQEGLERYRSDMLLYAQQQGIHIISEYVAGRTVEEIQASLQIAAAEYRRIEQEVLARQPAQLAPQATQTAVPSPHFVPPFNPQALANGLPSVVNPQPAAQQTVGLEQVMELTSEESIRNGTYAKNRHQLLAQLRAQSAEGAGNLGSNARFIAPQSMSPYSNPAPLQTPTQFMPQPLPQTLNSPQNQPIPAPVPPAISPAPNFNLNPAQAGQVAAAIRAAGGITSQQAARQAEFQARFAATPPIRTT